MNRWPATAIVRNCAVLLFGAALLLSPAPSASAQVATAIDGDTLRIGETVIRLEGIDAPEMKQPCLDQSGEEYRCGRKSKDVLAGLLLKGPVQCEETGKDRYGRTLAYCTAGSMDINREMIREGWAMAFVKYNDRYVADETQAKAAKLGIWAGSAQAPWDWRAAQIAANAPTGKCIIKGNISHGRKIYFMPFHQLYANVKIDESKSERWFCTEDEALAAGWQRALR